ncbi:hypothetical protein HK100_007678 [Physocladia obscura]|uniref:Ribokinase n=1 Tax=Physocladia obscura TaxID=109957 RepID=A0AAD5SRF4_9FUNG|nr:hypothetical protein HK100_007678 [Physocladia obscura]
MKIVCFGSLNIDEVFNVTAVVKTGETIASLGYAQYPGGKGANQSVALARALHSVSNLDISVMHVGSVGADGVWLVDLLATNNINTTNVLVSQSHKTGCAIIQRDASGDNAIVLVPGANFNIPQSLIHNALESCDLHDWLLVQNEIAHIQEIITTAKDAHQMKVVFNPAPCPPNILEYPLDCVDILILNESEARVLFNSLSLDVSFVTTQSHLHTVMFTIMKAVVNLEAVIVTLGANGVFAIHRDISNGSKKLDRTDLKMESIEIQALKNCLVLDTTGAGDTFVGYFVAHFATTGDFRKALEIAVVASGIACESNGAIPSIPTLSNVLARIET